MHRRLLTLGPLLIGVGLLVLTLVRTDLGPLAHLTRQLGAALLVALVPGAAWHILRTIAWRSSFPASQRPSLARLTRVRLAAEAFSFVTIRGVAGEPLKVVLLQGEVTPIVAAAAIALERVAYLFVTAAIVTVSAAAAMIALPLTSAWMRVFGVIAAVGLVMMIVPVALLARGERLSARQGTPDRLAPSSRTAIARFAAQVGVQFRELVCGDRRRLAFLLALETTAYLMMAAEVWAALRLTHVPITTLDAFAVETFTRVTSMASAFIPANLGALEASNVAAAVAVHAAGGAAALAVVRRIRGLLWCAVGFMIYPRADARAKGRSPGERAPSRGTARPDAVDSEDSATLVVLEQAAPGVTISDRLGGLPIGERMLRAAARARFTRVLVWSPSQASAWNRRAARMPPAMAVVAENDQGAWRLHIARLDPQRAVTVLAPGVIVSPPLLEAAREMILEGEEHRNIDVPFGVTQATGVFRTRPHSLLSPVALAAELTLADGCTCNSNADTANQYSAASLCARTSGELASAERRLRRSVFKSTDGVLGRFNRRLSLPLSIALIRWTRFSAHAMTVLLMALGLYAGWLFSRGDYLSGIIAALVSWIASVLDGCDGELARLQYTDSAFGCWLDTLGDYTYYLAVFGGLTVGAVRQTGWAGFWHIGAVLLVGVFLTVALLILLRERITGGRPEDLRRTAAAHFYGAGKRWARLVARLAPCATRATMPYGILVFAVLGQLPWVVVLAAVGAQVYWISLSLEFRRMLDGPRFGAARAPY